MSALNADQNKLATVICASGAAVGLQIHCGSCLRASRLIVGEH
jgi:hypothetical protein